MTLTERFLKYVSFCTTSDEETNMTPSTPGQMEFAKYLAAELQAIGMQEVTLDDNGYVMATLPANVVLLILVWRWLNYLMRLAMLTNLSPKHALRTRRT